MNNLAQEKPLDDYVPSKELGRFNLPKVTEDSQQAGT